MRTLEELDLVPTWVNPNHTVATAIHIMQGHHVKAVAVINDTELIGLVTLARAQALPKSARVLTIVEPVSLTVEESSPIRAVATQFVDEEVSYAAVYRHEEFRGLLTANMLLRELGRSWDPLTNLPWSNRLRDWGTAELESGHEVTIVFIDIDDFGNYNKRHGHIIGDKVLKATAAKLREHIDRSADILVRYGGDEFVIGTLLNRFTAERQFADLNTLEITVPEVPEPVTVTVGFAGGKRTSEREHAHTASTLDNLINLASRECMNRKRKVMAVVETELPVPTEKAEPAPPKREDHAPVATAKTYKVGLVSADEEDPEMSVAVSLVIDGVEGTGAALPEGRELTATVAEATANAIERIRPDVEIEISRIVVDTGLDGEKTVTVVGTCEAAGRKQAISDVRPVNRNVHRAVAEAVAAAFCSIRKPRRTISLTDDD